MNQLQKPKPECKLVIAGPGAGKTHNMVEKVLACLETLHPTRFCAVITYTNAATEEIKSRLSKTVKIPSNVFIGTIHSFLNKFVFAPFAQVKGIIDDDYILIDKAKLNYTATGYAKINAEKTKANNLADIGIITYDKLLEKTKDLIQDNMLARQIANRLEYVFVDEYQDIRLWQHEVFMRIFEQGKTHFYCIGDPLQSIFQFAYTHSQNSKEKAPSNIEGTPIFLLQSRFGICQDFEQKNHRSRPVIINLISMFSQKIKLKQDSHKEPSPVPIYFLNNGVPKRDRDKKKGNDKIRLDFITKEKIIDNFKEKILFHQIEKEDNNHFQLVLVEEWDTISKNENELNAKKLDKNNDTQPTYFKQISRLVLSIIGYKLTEIFDKKDLNEVLKYRKFCLKVYKYIKKANQNDIAKIKRIKEEFTREFGLKIGTNSDNIDIGNSLKSLTTKNTSSSIYTKEESPLYFSSIHSAKGLEATNVLVIAVTQNELKSWLDYDSCLSDKDRNRLGYVAFSRAKELLCIACLEEIDEELKNRIEKLNIQIIPNCISL